MNQVEERRNDEADCLKPAGSQVQSRLNMTIRVRYFASLREKLGRIEDTLVAEDIATVSDVWKIVSGGEPWPDKLLCAVNMEYADAKTSVNEDDEVAFFPPVTGG